MVNAYVSIDYDEAFVKVSEATYNEARWAAIDMAENFMDKWGRTKYTGKKMVPIHEIDKCKFIDEWEYCQDCPAVLCWCFDIYEGSYRK